MRHRTVCAALLMLVCAVSPLAAQATDSSRVRITTRNGWQVVGTLLATHDDSVSVRPDGQSGALAIAFDSVAVLEVSPGIQRHGGRGFLVGAGYGVAIGAVIVALTTARCQCDSALGSGADVLIGGVLGGVVGGVIGTAVGYQHRDNWRSVPIPRRRDSSLMPTFGGGRAGLVASFSF